MIEACSRIAGFRVQNANQTMKGGRLHSLLVFISLSRGIVLSDDPELQEKIPTYIPLQFRVEKGGGIFPSTFGRSLFKINAHRVKILNKR